MNENDRYPSGSRGKKTAPSREVPMRAEPGAGKTHGMAKTVSDASDAVATEAKALGHEAQNLAGEQAEKVKEAAASHLDIFADALRSAGDELARNQTGPAGEFVASAASGLEGLSRSLHGKSTAQMVDAVRHFGRENPLGFLAGSVLAGLALSRFVAAGGKTGAHPADDPRSRPPAPRHNPSNVGTGGQNR